MSTQPIDYDALAKQAGAISSTPAPASGEIDYDALAKQAGAISSTPPASSQSGARVSNQPAPGTWPWFKTKLYQAVDATANALPAGGAMVGALAGAPEGGPIGAVGGAGIGGMAGSAAKHLVRRAAGFEESNDPNAVANDIAKEGAIQGAVQGVTEGLPTLGLPLKNAALSQYSRALAPTTKANKAIVQDIAPEMMNRGVHGSFDSIEQQASDQAANLRPQLTAAYKAMPASSTQGAGTQVIKDLDALKSQYVVAGKVANPEAVNAISGVQDIVKQYGPDIKPEDLRSLKQIFDEPVSGANGYAGADLSTHYTLNAKEAAANSMRRILNSASPDVGALNKEISFWLDVQRVAHDSGLRTTGQAGGLSRVFTPLGMSVAGAAGFAHGGSQLGLEAATATALASAANEMVRSTAWKTTSAIFKNRVANALASGDIGQVAALGARLGLAIPGTLQATGTSGQTAQPTQ